MLENDCFEPVVYDWPAFPNRAPDRQQELAPGTKLNLRGHLGIRVALP